MNVFMKLLWPGCRSNDRFIVADYRHVGTPSVQLGDRVLAGQQLAVRDRSLAYDYLHFELSYRGLVLDPAVLDPRWSGAVGTLPVGSDYALASISHRGHAH